MDTFLKIIYLVLPFVICYLIGSISFGIIVGKLFFHKDVRDYGSHNAGGTNAGRVFGYKVGLIVIILDMLKTFGPMVAFYFIYKYTLCKDPNIDFYDYDRFALFIGGFAGTLGHCFPIFYKFKGGKAVSSFGGICIITSWFVTIIGFITFFVVLKIKKHVSLASIITAIVCPLASIAVIFLPIGMNFGIKADWIYSTFLGLTATLLIIRHIPNIKRLINHEESTIKWMK